jgi:penicillin-binding protein 1A
LVLRFVGSVFGGVFSFVTLGLVFAALTLGGIFFM